MWVIRKKQVAWELQRERESRRITTENCVNIGTRGGGESTTEVDGLPQNL